MLKQVELRDHDCGEVRWRTGDEWHDRCVHHAGSRHARVYEIYLQRGAQPGYELEDWLQAERELST